MGKQEAKGEVVADLAQKFKDAQGVIITEYRGLNVAEISRLRGQLRPLGVRYQVVKNTLARRAAAEVGVDDLDGALTGPTALAFCQGDVVAGARALLDYARTSRVMTVTGGVLGSRVISANDVVELSRTPPREVLLARVLGGLQAPMAGIVSAVSGPMRGLLYALQARVKQLEEAGAA